MRYSLLFFLLACLIGACGPDDGSSGDPPPPPTAPADLDTAGDLTRRSVDTHASSADRYRAERPDSTRMGLTRACIAEADERIWNELGLTSGQLRRVKEVQARVQGGAAENVSRRSRPATATSDDLPEGPGRTPSGDAGVAGQEDANTAAARRRIVAAGGDAGEEVRELAAILTADQMRRWQRICR